MALDERGSALIKRIYSAGENQSAWDAVIVDLFQVVGSIAGVCTLVDLDRRQPYFCRLYGAQNGELAISAEDYASRIGQDPTLGWAAVRPNSKFVDSAESLEPSDYPNDPFAQWTFETFGTGFWYSGFVKPSDELTFCLTAHFTREQYGGSKILLAQFRLLFDHLECALRMSNRPPSRESARALLRMGKSGTVDSLSKGAERLLGDRSPLLVTQGRLLTSRKAEQRVLDRAIERTRGSAGAPPNPTAIQVSHENGRPWLVVVRPLPENYGPFGKLHRNVEIEILDRIPAVPRLDLVQSLFGLTARELQVVRLLGEGHSIDSLSATIEVSRNTTRAHLRSIYAKTKTTSQVELIQLCSGLSTAAADHQLADLMALN